MLTESGRPVVIHVFFRPDIVVISISIVLFALVAVIASINPARKASGISVADALRWV
jgi:ABC-type lipoprotein release transport system permease subunit